MNNSHQSTLAQARIKWVIYGVIALLLIGSLRTLWARHTQAQQLAINTPELAKQYVVTENPQVAKEGNRIELPGTLQGYMETPIYARSNGYLLHWYKDIGSKVNKGELLAEIDSPEIDQQLAQSQAARRQMQANLELSKNTLARWEQLRQRQVVSQQEFDEHKNQFAQAEANLAVADADMQRLQQLSGFKRITAPFTGVITKRNIDVGNLISPGTGDVSKALFLLAQTDKLKLYVDVPQTYASDIKVGQSVDIRQTELSGETFKGKIEHTSGAIDTRSRTLQIEVVLANTAGKLMPGAYVTASFTSANAQTISVPSNTLLFRPEGTRIAVVDAQSKVDLKAVTLGHDFGSRLEILSGLEASDHIIVNPPDSLSDGDQVIVTSNAQKPAEK